MPAARPSTARSARRSRPTAMRASRLSRARNREAPLCVRNWFPGRPRMKAKATPQGYHTLNPILRVPNAAVALDFYKGAFNAKEDFRREMHGKLLIAVIMIGDSRLMISDQQNDPDKVSGGDPRGNGLDLKIYV